jgi:hypothetical protein
MSLSRDHIIEGPNNCRVMYIYFDGTQGNPWNRMGNASKEAGPSPTVGPCILVARRFDNLLSAFEIVWSGWSLQQILGGFLQ